MAAVIRVKRALSQDPAEALILNCKKRKLGDSNAASASIDSKTSTVFRFAATLQSDDDILKHLKLPLGQTAEGKIEYKSLPVQLRPLQEQYKRNSHDVKDNIRQSFRDVSRENRMKLINTMRDSLAEVESCIEEDDDSDDNLSNQIKRMNKDTAVGKDVNVNKDQNVNKDLKGPFVNFPFKGTATSLVNQKTALSSNDNTNDFSSKLLKDEVITIVDIDRSNPTENTLTEAKYVYDLYYTNSDDFGDFYFDESATVHPFDDILDFGSRRDNNLSDTESEDSDDSNDENNWRNDYPDEDDMESIDEEDMMKAMNDCEIGNDLSDDAGEENLVYSDEETASYDADVDPSDAARFGDMYARFKARLNRKPVKKSLGPVGEPELYYGDIDDEEEEYYY